MLHKGVSPIILDEWEVIEFHNQFGFYSNVTLFFPHAKHHCHQKVDETNDNETNNEKEKDAPPHI